MYDYRVQFEAVLSILLLLIGSVLDGFPDVLALLRVAKLNQNQSRSVWYLNINARAHWSVIEHRTRKQDIEVGKYTAQNLENMADLHDES